ncbi:hypothetical protein [Marinovum algicola]
MIISFFRRWRSHPDRIFRRLPPDLPPHMMRDIGLPPRPDRPRIPLNRLW